MLPCYFAEAKSQGDHWDTKMFSRIQHQPEARTMLSEETEKEIVG